MAQMLLAKYFKYNIREVADKLDAVYYTTLEGVCNKTEDSIELLQSLETHTAQHNYLVACTNFITEVTQFVALRKEVVVPYLHELFEKDKASHDCLNCSGNCSVQHTLKTSLIRESLNKVQQDLQTLKATTLNWYDDSACSEHFKTVLNKMLLLETMVKKVIELETEVLLPKIAEAQTKIHAAG